ncbi:sensor histidine kinase [Lederbergia panacisoli]|uniref:sensor histidine kinase n=1 Tax=Lederbergia panacisoli TaxID=1255251 RepID=UPI00214B75AB|nr:histidine kinase [Lederbergia panacisoli]MCR2822969.1 histidine kinase [Lederbergia panacisoli]
MKLNIGKHPSRSVNYYSKILFIILISILLINLFVTFFTIWITRQQSVEYITNTINLYLKDTRLKFNAVDHFMVWTIKNEPLIEDIEKAKDMSELPKSIHNFRTRVNDFQYSTGKEYQFFLALKKENYFFNSSPIQMDYSEYLEIKKFFLSEKRNINMYENIDKWKPLKIDKNYYLYHLLEYENRMFISLIAMDDILLPLQEINLGDKGMLMIEDDANGFLSGSKEGSSNRKLKSIFTSYLLFPQEDTGLPFSLHVSVDYFSAYKQVAIAQFVLVLATFLISLNLFLILGFLRNKVLSPIQNFSKNLSEINKNNEKIDFRSSIIELEQANEQFKGLMSEIRKLKIDYYEQEFEKKQIQMDFMKLQIKPHFYLSCLTTIHSMAEMEMYKEIKKMTISTSNYFRYLFQTNQNYVKLEKELNHIQDYLSIQKLLHAHSFKFDIQTEPSIEKAMVPPLMIQTFIENTVKHAISLDEQINIRLHIRSKKVENRKWIIINLLDNGPGFPADILETLQNQMLLTTKNGNHIGINNVTQRLRLLFDEDFQIEFSNIPDWGAMIQITIPYIIDEERVNK